MITHGGQKTVCWVQVFYLMGPRNQNEVTRLRDKAPLTTESLAGPDHSSFMCSNSVR